MVIRLIDFRFLVEMDLLVEEFEGDVNIQGNLWIGNVKFFFDDSEELLEFVEK